MTAPPLYGRKEDIEYLQRVVHSILLKQSFVDDGGKDCGTVFSDSTAPTVSTSSTGNEQICDCYCSSSTGNIEVNSSYKGKSISSDGRFIVISGPAGSGKRSLGREVLRRCRLQNPVCRCSNFLQISGQFRRWKDPAEGEERKKGNNPYTRTNEWDRLFTAFHDAVRELIDIIIQDVELTHAVLDQLKHSFKGTKDVALLTQAFPCMKNLLHLESRFVPKRNDDSSPPNRFCCVHLHDTPSALERCPALRLAVTVFFHAVSVCMPLILMLEDFQYADAESLALIESLLAVNPAEIFRDSADSFRSKGLLIVATCVMDASAPTSYRALRKLFCPIDLRCEQENRVPSGLYRNQHGHAIHHVPLSNLTWDEVHEWTDHCTNIQRIPYSSPEQMRSITDIVFHYSEGNPFHLQYLFQLLELDKMFLSKELDEQKSIPITIPEAYTSILEQQDASVLNLVRYAAALSIFDETNVVDCEILRLVVRKPCAGEVLRAQASGLLDFFPAHGYVQFSRMELQTAAYETISDTAATHFSIGRSLWNDAFLLHDQKNSIDDEIKHKLLLAILHMRNCLDLVTDFDERMHMSQLCYEYGLAVSSIGDFATSAKLFEFAICVVGSSEIWRPDLYETSLVLHNAAVQTYLYIGKDDYLERTLDAIFTNAKCFKDKLSAYITTVYARAKHQYKDGFRIASFVSSELGEPIQPNSGTWATMKSILKLNWSLLAKSDDFLINLPEASEDNLIIAHFLSFAMFYILVICPRASMLICRRLIYLSVKNGISGPSAVAFSLYGYSLSGRGKLEEGYRFGRLALAFADRFEVWRPRIYFYTYGFTMLWTHRFSDSLEPLRQGQRDAIKYGDLLIYGTSAAFSIFISCLMGSTLIELQADARSFCESLAEVEQLNPLIFLLPMWSVINELTGKRETLNIAGEIRDADTVAKYAIKEGVTFLLGYFYTDHAMLYYLLGDFDKSLDMAKKAYEYRKRIDFKLTFYEGIATLAKAWTLSPPKRHKYINHGRKLARMMKNWADRCPENFRNKQLLMFAELAALNGKPRLAITLFKESIARAKNEGFLHEEGIAHERLGQYQLCLGNTSCALHCLNMARRSFELWEANTIVARIDRLLALNKPEEVN